MAADKENSSCATGEGKTLRKSFIDGKLTSSKTDGSDKLALVRSLGETKKAEGHLLLGYDDLYSIQYFGENLRPYWNRNGNETIQSQFAKADKEYDAVMDKCAAFDANLMKEATEVGGRKYAELCALAYRQAIAAHKLVEAPIKTCCSSQKRTSATVRSVRWISLILLLLCSWYTIRNWQKV